ncbi:MAG: MBOAT family O-acyltransferase [Zymomonas mobilis]|uniref:MBOAT family O-acyltransferase n=1 Tax=Zymomonas mobilis TaxID=542 RepID=UPI0001B70488|nr:MBOAT family O-acyltransferase [Zymomonas mobilis]ACV75348.1 membrane bound O-acyl transferase MBOAT family protein [Zymomonas mobilis subsp. mobilis NCIMB 11163]
MLFPTLTFGLFFLVVFSVACCFRSSNDWRKIALLIASWFFYGWWDWRFVALLILSAVFNWAMAAWLSCYEGKARKRIMIAGIIGNVSILAFFKYYAFLLNQIAAFCGLLGYAPHLPFMEIVLPVGVSFFTFQGMSYLVDVEKRKVPPASLGDILLLMSFFPHLVAGPIVRASELLPQFKAVPPFEKSKISMALLLIVWGLFKKAVVASEISTQLVDPVFFDPSSHSSLELVMAAYGYAAQIYCDFSAYSDMAIGLAALLGYRFPVNFNQPYRAASLQDFWRRWHISLSSWLRDYVYIGWLGGNRCGAFRTYLNLFITMLIGGLWHGANMTFVIWGALHGGVLACERFWSRIKPASWPSLPVWIRTIFTFHIVVVGWIFFRADSFSSAIQYLKNITQGSWSAGQVTPLMVMLVLFGLVIHFLPRQGLTHLALRIKNWPSWSVGIAIAVLILIIDAMRYEGVAPFIYYQF